jgi:DNA helicase-2/ATP-dependent DNA helicase PcrA
MSKNPALDIYQQQFCDSHAENIRLLAPAGSGKTHSLLWRCLSVHRARGGAARFLVLTFTRAARDELRKRLSGPEFNEIRSSVEVSTLNSWGWRRVRQNFHSSKLHTSETDRSFCVQNALQPVWKRHPAIKHAMEAQAFQAGKVVMNLIDLLKSLGFNHTGTAADARKHLREIEALGLRPNIETAFRDLKSLGSSELFFEEAFDTFAAFWLEACQHLFDQALFTLEDQKYAALKDLQSQLAAGKRPVGGSRYTHLLVDEFQDVNPLDLALIREIAGWHQSAITIVGDDDQAIFEWRGATFRYIVSPEDHFERKFETFILEKNYRCPRNIVEHSQRLIRINKRRVPKAVKAVQTTDAVIELLAAKSFSEILDKVIAIVSAFQTQNVSGGGRKIALISRKRAQLIPYQILLASKDIPFCAAEDLQVFLSKAFENLTKVLSICEDARTRPRPRQIVDDVLLMCDLVKRYPLKKAEKQAVQRQISAGAPKSHLEALDLLANYEGPLKGANEGSAMSRSFADSIRRVLLPNTVAEVIDALSAELSGLEKDYGKSHEDIFYSDPPFFYLAQFASRYGDDFGRFIEDLDNAARQLAQLPPEDDDGADVWSAPVHLMTALRAKGKEFDTVVLLDVNDGIWPTVHAETEEQKEQERRLFYVAMTRAKTRLVAAWSSRLGDHSAEQSPFLSEAGLV